MKIPCSQCGAPLETDELQYPACETHCYKCYPEPSLSQMGECYNYGPAFSLCISEQTIQPLFRPQFSHFKANLSDNLWRLDMACDVLLPRLLTFSQNAFVRDSEIGMIEGFWTLSAIIGSLAERAVLHITSCGDNSVNEAFDLKKWINKELWSWMDPQYEPVRRFLWGYIESVEPERTMHKLNKLIGELKVIRCNNIAHMSREYLRGEKPTMGVYIPDLQKGKDYLFKVYQILFGAGLMPMEQVTGGKGIDYILDSCKLNSMLLTAPERCSDPQLWEMKKKRFSDEQLLEMVRLREIKQHQTQIDPNLTKMIPKTGDRGAVEKVHQL